MAITLNGSAGVTTNSGAVYNSIQSDTAKTASGTSVDFTSIPSWVKRITVMFDGVSVSGTSNILIQLGDSGGIENTGYVSASGLASSTTSASSSTAGFIITASNSASDLWYGAYVISLISTNQFCGFGNLNNVSGVRVNAGSKTLSATLDRLRITTVNGTDTFDAGSINILYE
jgi:hypothetical protein